jgi:transglutaminase-like putative cysteine protease
MVGFAFLALVGGGGMGDVASLGGTIALIVSWWWEPPRVRLERGGWVWTVLSVFVFVYSVLTAVVSLDILFVGAQFMIWLTVVKAFNRRAARDWQQMYLLAFLMLVAGSVLNPDITYGLFFFGFVISSTWALTLFHLRREMEDNLLVKHAADRASERVEVRRILDSRRIVGGRFFVGTGFLSFGVFIGAAIVFLALPRVGIGFFLKARNATTMTGFSDSVKLGGHGVIKRDETVVMRVEIDSRYGSREAPAIHWRGVAFDLYARGQWSRGSKAPTTNQSLELGLTRDRRVLAWAGPRPTVPEIERLAQRTIKQDIWLEPLDSDVLFGASDPRIVEYPHTMRRRNLVEKNDEIRLEHGSTVHYTVFSEIDEPTPEELRASAGLLPPSFYVYLQLPPEITPRTYELARRITANAPTAYDKVLAIKDWLGKNATYTLELEDPGDQEPVDHFLFDRKQGHCEYFASAFAILARAAGIPVRQVNGFLGGEWNEYQNYIAVRAGDAHSWDEVFFPGVRGGGVWVTIDPTPPGDVDALGRGGTGFRAKLARFIDTIRFQWTKWVIDYDLASQLSLFKSIGSAIKSAAVAVKEAVIAAKDYAVEHWPISTPLGAMLLGLLVWRHRKKRGPRAARDRTRAIRAERSTVGEIYDRAAKHLTKAGFPRATTDTPRELAERMATRRDPAAAQVGELTELYYLAEWGARRDATAEERAAALLREIRDRLAEAKKRAPS